jgi:hypothetical protein
MRKGSSEPVERRHLTFPKSFNKRLSALKSKRGAQSDSEILRQAINLLEAVSKEDDAEVYVQHKNGEKVKIVLV